MHVSLITPWQTGGGIAHYSERFATALEAEDVTVTPVPIQWPNTANPRRFNRVLDRVPAETDVIHVQFEAGVFGRLGVSGVCALPFFRRVSSLDSALVTTLHEVHRTHPHLPLPGDYLLRGRDFLIERAALRASDAVVVHTETARRILHDRHGDRGPVVQLHHPVEMTPEPDASETPDEAYAFDGDVILTFGWVEAKKRYADVIDVLPALPEARYLIAGRPRADRGQEILEEALAHARQLGVDDRVEYLGFIEDADVPALFEAADVVVLPYGRVSQSGSLNLALGYERPVLTSSLAPFEELQDEFGCPATYGDAEELERELKVLLDDTPERRRLIEAAREYADALTWPNFARDSVELYRRMTAAET